MNREEEGGFSSGNLSYSENEDGVSIIDQKHIPMS